MAQKLTLHFLAFAAMLPSLGLANLEASVANAKRIAQRAGLEINLEGNVSDGDDILGNGFAGRFRVNGWEIFSPITGDVMTGMRIAPVGGNKRFRKRPAGFSEAELIAKAEGHLQKLGLVKGRDFELESVLASGDEKQGFQWEARLGGQRMSFRRPDYMGFRDGTPIASFTYYIPDGQLMAFTIMAGLAKPPLPEARLISLKEGAVKARAAALAYAQRAYPHLVSDLPSVEVIERTAAKVWRGPFRSPEGFPADPYQEEFRNHQLASYTYRVGKIRVFVRASNGAIIGGGMVASPSGARNAGRRLNGVASPPSPEVMAHVSGAPVVPAEPAPAPVAPAEPSRAPVAPAARMPDGLAAGAVAGLALMLGAWAIWGRKR
jgi:hypothetical protein